MSFVRAARGSVAALAVIASGCAGMGAPQGPAPAAGAPSLADQLAAMRRLDGIRFKAIRIPHGTLQTAEGINDSGAIVGNYTDSSSVQHGFLLQKGKLTNIDDPNGSPTLPIAISNNGTIAGEYTRPIGFNHGFVYSNGTFTDVGIDNISGANGVNDSGYVVGGYAHCVSCRQHGFLFNGSSYTTIDVPNATSTGVTSINDAGIMTVSAPDKNDIYHAYLYDGTTFTNIDVPGAKNSYVQGINDQGDVSFVCDADGQFNEGAVLHDGSYTTFYHPHAQIMFLGRPNDNGQIIGTVILKGEVFKVFEALY